MKIAIGQLWQETNTFNPLPTTRAGFESFGVWRGDELVTRMAETNELGGFIQSLRAWPERPDIAGLVRLAAWPSGPLTVSTRVSVLAEMLDALQAQLPVDGVLLALHGSLVAKDEPDMEGWLLDKVRSLIGPNTPLVATLDLHANVTQRMVDAADALVLYHTAPHIDVMDTGRRAARVLRRILVEGAKPTTAFRKLPLVVPAERANTQDPTSVSHAIREQLQAWEADPRVLAAGLATVQPWLDIPDLGAAVVVVTDGSPELGQQLCTAMAQHVWDCRRDYLPHLTPVEEAVKAAFDLKDGLTVLSDGADATTSGSTGDNTTILRELFSHDWRRPALVTLVAPKVVAEANARGVGATWRILLGGVLAPQWCYPVIPLVTVERCFDAKFVLSGHLAEKLPIDMGLSTVLRNGNVFIVATSLTGPHFAPQLFEVAGLDPFAAQVLVAKSPCGFRAAYQSRAKQIFLVRSTGCAPADFWTLPYHRIPRPMWPWDEMDDWRATS